MGRRIPIFVIAAVLLGAGLVRGLKAYSFTGPVWNTNQVTYYINPDNLYVSTTAAVAALQSAASAWSTQANPNMTLVYGGYTSGSSLTMNNKNEVFFRNASNGSLLAETYWWGDCCGHIIDADIVFYEANFVFYTGSGCTGTGEYIENVGTHEFGHMQGLAHSSVLTATMYPTMGGCDQTMESLDPDDISGIEALYPPTSGSKTTTTPSAPTGLAAAPDGSNPSSSVDLSWTDTATNASGYLVGRSTDGATFTQVAQLGSSATSYVDGGLSASTTYYYLVYAYNSAGSSSSNMASTQTQATTAQVVTQAPAAPSSPSPANGATNVSGRVTLSWGAASGAQAYDVYLGTSTSPTLRASNVTSTSVSAGTLNAGTTYFWMVVAKNSAGSTAGPLWTFTMKSTGKPKK